MPGQASRLLDRRGLGERDLNRVVLSDHTDPIFRMGKLNSSKLETVAGGFADCNANLLFEFKEQGLSACNQKKKSTHGREIESPLRRSRI